MKRNIINNVLFYLPQHNLKKFKESKEVRLLLKNVIDPRICKGMFATVCEDEKEIRTNAFILKIIPEGKRIRIIYPKSGEQEEFSLRKTGNWVKVQEKTSETKTRLIFPVIIRRDLVAAFSRM